MIEHAIDFLLNRSSSVPSTVKLTTESIALLKRADSISRFQECGWSYAMGFKGRDVLVTVQANSQEEIDIALGLHRPSYID